MLFKKKPWEVEREALFNAAKNGDLAELSTITPSDINGMYYNHDTLASAAIRAKCQLTLDYFYSLFMIREEQRKLDSSEYKSHMIFEYQVQFHQLDLNTNFDEKALGNIFRYAAQYGHADYLQFALDQLGSKITDQQYEFAYNDAALNHNLECMEILNGLRLINYSQLMYKAVESGDLKCVQFIAEKGGVDLKTFRTEKHLPLTGDLPLLLLACVQMNPFPLVIQLCELGLDTNVTSQYGSTALHVAASHRDIELARVLLAHGANVNVQSDHGNTPLAEASIFSEKIALEFLQYKPDLSLGNNRECIFNAFNSGHTKLVNALLDYDPSLANAHGKEGYTSLMMAIMCNKEKLVERLLKMGADVMATYKKVKYDEHGKPYEIEKSILTLVKPYQPEIDAMVRAAMAKAEAEIEVEERRGYRM